jgi:hypothetical protein
MRVETVTTFGVDEEAQDHMVFRQAGQVRKIEPRGELLRQIVTVGCPTQNATIVPALSKTGAAALPAGGGRRACGPSRDGPTQASSCSLSNVALFDLPSRRVN